jgi:hypothetical protein
MKNRLVVYKKDKFGAKTKTCHKMKFSPFFLTVTTAGVSQPEQIFSQVAYEAF